MARTFTAYIEYDPETGQYAGIVPGLPGGHSQGETLDELQRNLKEVIELILEETERQGEEVEVEPFIGIQQITIGK
jgi:predicted RNase H-like HicB family nuclease